MKKFKYSLETVYQFKLQVLDKVKEEYAMDPEVVEKARIITAGVAIATVVIAIFAMHPDPSIIDQFIDKVSKILFAPPSSVPNWQPT